jgi:hypothetical protein
MRWLLIAWALAGLLAAGCQSVGEEPNHTGPTTFQGIHVP